MHRAAVALLVPLALLAGPALSFSTTLPLPSAGRHAPPPPSTTTRRMAAPTDAVPTPPPAEAGVFAKNIMSTYGRYPITMVKGQGCKLWDSTGKEYLDFVAGISTCCLGHADSRLINAVTTQLGKLHHVSNLYYTVEQGKLGEWLVQNSVADKAFFCNSGAEANEAAIKLARKHAHEKLGLDFPVIITAKASFHGRTLATITATGQPKYQKGFEPLVPGFEYVEYNDAKALKKMVRRINTLGRLRGLVPGIGRKGVAAIMMEALQGEGGIRPGTQEFFKVARELCDETGALLMIDEVQTGVGRTGKLWGYENLGGIEPDVFTSAKALGAGVPIGAMMCKERANVFKPGDHASTFGGNPLACAAGLAVTKAIEEDGLITNAAARGVQIRGLLNKLQEKYPALIQEVRGWGLINGVELTASSGLLAAKVVQACIDDGLLLVAAGTTVVRFVPPLIVTEAEVEEAVRRFGLALEKVSKA